MRVEEGHHFESSRASLESPASGELEGGASELAREARSVVASADQRVSAVVAGPGEVRRVDLWVRDDLMVMHAYSTDRDLSCPGSLYRGRRSVFAAVAQLLGASGSATGSATTDLPLEFGSLTEIMRVVSERSDTGQEAVRMCALNPAPSQADAELLVTVGSNPLRWASARSDQTFVLSDTGLAQMWAHVVRILGDRLGGSDEASRLSA